MLCSPFISILSGSFLLPTQKILQNRETFTASVILAHDAPPLPIRQD
jgi:hypothetical protein